VAHNFVGFYEGTVKKASVTFVFAADYNFRPYFNNRPRRPFWSTARPSKYATELSIQSFNKNLWRNTDLEYRMLVSTKEFT